MGGWEYIGAGLLMFHFAFPFLMLLSQKLKKNPRTIARIAVYIIVIRLIDIIWLVEPNFGHQHLNIHWLDIAAPIGIGGFWLAYFFYNLRQRPISPSTHPTCKRHWTMDDITTKHDPHHPADPEVNPNVAYEHGDADVFTVSKYTVALVFGILIAAAAMYGCLTFSTER